MLQNSPPFSLPLFSTWDNLSHPIMLPAVTNVLHLLVVYKCHHDGAILPQTPPQNIHMYTTSTWLLSGHVWSPKLCLVSTTTLGNFLSLAFATKKFCLNQTKIQTYFMLSNSGTVAEWVRASDGMSKRRQFTMFNSQFDRLFLRILKQLRLS